ncbi:MAG: DUF3793 family protein [Treponema sp.]|nr:DUF3793 family protein [Treponema sp.]
MSFDQMMIHYNAPTLCDIKPGNLFFVRENVFSEGLFNKWKDSFASKGLVASCVRTSENDVLVLVYNLCWVRRILGDVFVQAYLRGKGYYFCSDVSKLVEQIFIRVMSGKAFPHEVGIILGYPLVDVIEFDKQEGRNCKYCGYWKSYSDVEKAKKCQFAYKDCSSKCKKWFDEGFSVRRIIKEYKKAVRAA